MKKLRLAEEKGIVQLFLLVGMLVVAVALPVTTKLVQQSQENRSSAAEPSASSCTSSNVGNRTCSDGDAYQCKKIVTNIPGSGGATSTAYNWKKEYDCKGCYVFIQVFPENDYKIPE